MNNQTNFALSKCCKSDVRISGEHNITFYYVCNNCNKACELDNQTLLTFPECMERAFLLPTEEKAKTGDLMIDGIGKLKIAGFDSEFLNKVNLYICSDAEIKEGEKSLNYDGLRWSIGVIPESARKYVKREKIEFTTDEKLIADKVPAIDGNTKAWIDTDVTGVWHKKEVNFLSEYCKLYNQKSSLENYTNHLTEKFLNQKDNQKVEVEKLAEEIYPKDWIEYYQYKKPLKDISQFGDGLFEKNDYANKTTMNTRGAFKIGVNYGVKEAEERLIPVIQKLVQSNAGEYSLEDMNNAYTSGRDGESVKQFNEFIQSLTDKQPKTK